jgi:tetratricopeptide (TPR) repeat protein
MLKGLFQSREDKIREQVESHISEGMEHLSSKFYNGAMIAFDKAMELNPEVVYDRLLEELNNVAAAGETEAALAVGLNLLKQKNDDYVLANKLGNYARQLKDYKQANGLYKTALKIKGNYSIALYNLAASDAKVDIYDEAIMSVLSQFQNVEDYKLPDYVGDDDIVEQLTEIILEAKRAYVQEKLQELLLEKDIKKSADDIVGIKEIDLEIKSLKELGEEVSVDNLIIEFQKKIENDPENATNNRFNLALYALSHKHTGIALKALDEIAVDAFDTIDLLKAIALDQKGQRNKAIDMLITLLGKNEYDRYNNLNLGLMLRKAGKKFLSIKYLIKTAYLLNKSNGIYSMKELLIQANEDYTQGKTNKALSHLKIVVTEIPDPEIWIKIGIIYLEKKKYDDAVPALKQALKLDPKSENAHERLKEIHDYFFNKGNELATDRNFRPAADYLKKAFDTMRLPETAKKAAEIYKQIDNVPMETKMTAEWKKLIAEEKAREEENMRQTFIAKSKIYLDKENYSKAAETLEAAFLMKVDQNIYLQLVTLYKNMNKKEALESLEARWEKMQQKDEAFKKHQKELDRKQQSD